jgi:hypothetical protein
MPRERHGLVSIGFSLSGHAVHLLLSQLLQALGLGAGCLVDNTIVETIRSSLAASAALGSGDCCAGIG